VALIVAFDAEVTRLIQLYIVGVFIYFTTSQLGMVRHWTRMLARSTRRTRAAAWPGRGSSNGFGFVMTGVVLVIVLITKAPQGRGITLIMMAVIFLTMLGHPPAYERLNRELRGLDAQQARALPARTHGVVPGLQAHQPALRAIAYARATRPNTTRGGPRRRWTATRSPSCAASGTSSRSRCP
jgi:hypothetical protein